MRRKSRYRLVVPAVLVFCGLGMTQNCRATNIEWYPVSPVHRSDGHVTGTVNGTPVTFEHFRNFNEYYFDVNYLRFAADGAVDVRLAVDLPVHNARLRTVLAELPLTEEGGTLSFALPGPGQYYLQLPGAGAPERGKRDSGTYTLLFLIDDIRKMDGRRFRRGDLEAADVTRHGVRSHPEFDQTEAIQSILDDAGKIYFPPGVYRTGTLQLRSNTSIYFEAGAVLKAVDDPAKLGREYIGVYNAENVTIAGPGVIDANYDGAGYEHMVHIINTDQSSHLAFEDVLLQNSNSWALHILRSDSVDVRNLKIFSGKDGIDPDCSRDVRIDSVCVLSYDDAVAVKVRLAGETTERVSIRNSILASKASALKVGTETRGLMRDVLFENCEVFDSDRGIILYARDGGPIENVVWRDIHLSMMYWPTEDGGSPIQVSIENRDKANPTPTPVRNCCIENVTCRGTAPCEFGGLAETPLDGLTLKNMQFNVPRPGTGRPPLILVSDHVKTKIEGLKIDWQGNEEAWSGIVEGEGLTITPL